MASTKGLTAILYSCHAKRQNAVYARHIKKEIIACIH